ncbi:MAG: alpha/beta fold hydrolase [SAR324 cluster bacterium]|nr:alpha/beta fold hydrolase [SAR324 cluster bacterium]
MAAPKTFVLVHGSWHGSWCWDKVVPLLRQGGHGVVAVDLPGRAGDPTPAREITLDSLAEKICHVIARQSRPVVLVGHSMGGIAVTQAAEMCAEKIETLVYVCGFLLQNGHTLAEVYHAAGQGLTQTNLIADEGQGTVFFTNDAPLREIFYHDCSDEDFKRAKALLVPEPAAPRRTPGQTSDGRFGRIPRVYVETLQDKSIPPSLQKRMYSDLPCRKVFSMTTGHSPFFAAPRELADYLIAASLP